MDGPQVPALVRTALRCYPARWRQRHGDEAAEVAVLLIRDGGAASTIAVSYLAGAAREWLTPLPGRRVSPVACMLLAAACSLALSAGLLTAASPARAATPSHGHGSVHCALVPPEAAVKPVAASRQRRFIGEAPHGWSC